MNKPAGKLKGQAAARFTAKHVADWKKHGVTMIENFFTPEEVAAVCADFETVFPRETIAEAALNEKEGDEIGAFRPEQFTDIKPVPIHCSPALNLIGVHPALIEFAKAVLETDDVHLYQCQSWAKFTGEADYDQVFHCDYVNHTLTAPSEDNAENSVPILCYFTDVTEAHGPMHYVRRSDSLKIAGPEATLNRDPEEALALQNALRPFERSSASPAGSVVPYDIDVYHRGTNLTAPGGKRYALMTCFKRASNDKIGFHAWPFHHTQPWTRIFHHATPEQLACFGVPRPGNSFWTPVTLERAQARYPKWDMTPYRDAMA